MSNKKKILLIILGLVVAGLVLWSFRPQPVPVSVSEVERGTLRVSVQQEGRTRVRERYIVSAPLPGLASRVTLDPGDVVEVGQPLLRLHPTPALLLDPRSRSQAEARVTQAEAALEAAEARLQAAEAAEDFARRALERAKTLHERGDISEGSFDEAETAAVQATAERRAARFAVEAARGELNAARAAARHFEPGGDSPVQDVVIKAPVGGSVLEVMQESQAVVQAGQPLLSIGDTRLLEVAADVLSEDAVRISPGMTVLFHRWGGPEALEGRVRTVEPSGFTKVSALGVEEQRVWVIADIVSPYEQWASLGDGYRVEAEFVLWQGDSVLKTAASALFRQDGEWAAFVVEEGVARLRIIRIGHRGALEVEVVEGLETGDRVITHPGDSVADGVAVSSR